MGLFRLPSGWGKALKALHLHHGQQSWGHDFGRSFRDLPPPIAEALATEVQDLEDRLRILDALYIPTRFPAKAEPPVCWPVRQLCTGYGVVALKQARHYLLEDLRAAHARIPAPAGHPFDPDTLQSMDRNLGRFPRDVTPAYILSPSQSEGTYAYSEY